MYRYSLFLLFYAISLSADYDDYMLQYKKNSKPIYFVKIGAYIHLKDAINQEEKSSSFHTHIIHMKKYYSVVSDGFSTQQEALNYLNKIKKHYKDAYIFSLYKNQEKRVTFPKASEEETPLTEYQKAVALYHAKRYEEALASFDRVLIDDENNMSAHLYYAKTLYQLGLYKEAISELEKLSYSKQLTSTQKDEIQQYLKMIQKEKKRNFFHISISLGAGYDDNINFTTDKETTQYGSLTLQNDTNKIDSTYGLASLSLVHRYNTQVFDIITSLYSYNEFAHTAKGNNLNFIDFQTGIAKQYNKLRFYLPVGINSSYLDGSHVSYNIYTNPSISYYINNNFMTSFKTIFLDNTSKYMNDKDYHMFGVNGGFKYQTDIFEGGIFGGFNQFDAKTDRRFDVDKDVGYANFYGYYTFSENFVGFYSSYNREKFNILDTVLGYKREDDIVVYGISIGRNINQHISTTLDYRHTSNDSNINVYSYDKNNYTFHCKYKF